MIDRPQGGERAVLVHINFPAGNIQEDLIEIKDLALSAGADIVDCITGTKTVPDAKYFVGTGKAEEIKQSVEMHKAELIIVNHALSPAQERNLERLLDCRVIDRTGLILDIFAQRARSFEGKLQVELARLKHLSTRLVRGWTHLERQRGGIGVRGGPGETQLETDRRLVRLRIKQITKDLNRVRSQRSQGRRARKRAKIPTVTLVGYTNAGKSTLFNVLTGEDVYIANRLFATLDPTLRRIDIPEFGPVILADTVGFIRHLPHDLVEAFKGTLDEVSEADLLLHVIDVNDERREDNISQVNTVLESIGAGSVPQLFVYNKIDLSDIPVGFLKDINNKIKQVWISAQDKKGLTELQIAIGEWLGEEIIERSVELTPAEAKLRAKLYNLKAVISEQITESGGYLLTIRLQKNEMEKLFSSR
ncbi:MAG: GTPase HflX [Gammaproteobacteria bacterium]|nr:GTPase HflX [Gammaproteobacteria bacterium]